MFKNKLNKLEKGLMLISYLFFALGIVISIILIYVLHQHTSLVSTNDSIDNELTGVIGDFFGGVVGTLFALVSVLLFYLAFQHQKRELKITNEAFRNQQFETTFFNLLKNQTELRKSLINQDNEMFNREKYESIEFLDFIKERMIISRNSLEYHLENFTAENKIQLDKDYSDDYSKIFNEPDKKCKIIYKRIYSRYNEKLSHYFRHLHHILVFLKENEQREIALGLSSPETIKKKYQKYANYIQAQLSGSELFLIFYDALFFNKFRKLVRYFKLIENLNINELLYKVDIEFYGNLEENEDIREIDEMKFESTKEQLKV